MISGRRFLLSKKLIAGSQAELLKFLEDLHDCLQQTGESAPINDAGSSFPSTLDIAVSLLAPWLNLLAFQIETQQKPEPRRQNFLKLKERSSPDTLYIVG